MTHGSRARAVPGGRGPARLAALAGLALLLTTATAAGQTREADAERLFREGQKLLEEGRYGEACPKFEAAYDKDGQLGTLLNLAFCHKEQGALWSAWLEFRTAEIKATEQNRKDRKAFAHKRLVELGKRLPKVVVDNPDDVPLTAVLVEDRRVPEAERGAVFAAEAGERKLTFKAEGKKSATVIVTIKDKGRVQHVQVPPMEDLGPEGAAPVSRSEEASPSPEPPPDDDGAHAGGAQRTLGYVALGLGGVSLAVGAVTGVLTMTNPCAGNFSKGECPSESDKQRGETTGLVATISFGVAAGAGLAGLVLLLTAPDDHAPKDEAPKDEARLAVTPTVGFGWAGLAGSF